MEEELQKYKTLLKERGLKTTTQRMAILKVLLEQPGTHLTAEDIYDQVKKEWPKMGLATVYRNIQLLSEMHLIDKFNLGDGVVRYEISKLEPGMHHHHSHLICTSCGKIFCIQEDLLDMIEKHVSESMGFQVTDHDLKLYGRCADCLRKDAGEDI